MERRMTEYVDTAIGKITPLRGFVIAQRFTSKDKTESGVLYLPAQGRKRNVLAVVKAVGPPERKKGKEIPCDAKTGDVIVMPEGQGWTQRVGRSKKSLLTWIRQNDVKAIVDGIEVTDDMLEERDYTWESTLEV